MLKTVRSLTNGRGADYAFEVIGLSQTLPLDDINQAMTALEKGEVARSVIVM